MGGRAVSTQRRGEHIALAVGNGPLVSMQQTGECSRHVPQTHTNSFQPPPQLARLQRVVSVAVSTVDA